MPNTSPPAARGAIDISAVRGAVEPAPDADLPWLAVVRRCADDAVVTSRAFATKEDAEWFVTQAVVGADQEKH